MGIFQMPPGFWETKAQRRALYMYQFAPFLEEAGLLLLSARRLWHHWSVGRQEELKKVAFDLNRCARSLRISGLVWSGETLNAALENPRLTLNCSVYHRYYTDELKEACPEAAHILTSAAARILFFLLPEFEKAEKAEWREKGRVKWLSEIIETLMESPCIGPCPQITEDVQKILGLHALLLECEGLAQTQAHLETILTARSGESRLRKKNKSSLSYDQICKLAADINVPVETLKDALESEHSKWWDQAGEFRRQAQTQKEKFLSLLSVGDDIKLTIRSAYEPGSATSESPSYLTEEDCAVTERAIKLLVMRLAAWIGQADEEFDFGGLFKNKPKALPASRPH